MTRNYSDFYIITGKGLVKPVISENKYCLRLLEYMKSWLYDKSSIIFWWTLILYLITIFTVSYVGVYLTYVAIPVIVISGLIMYCTAPKEES